MLNSQAARSLLDSATDRPSRSNALNPLAWLAAMLLSTTLISFYLNLPVWTTYAFTSLTVFVVLVYIGAYLYLLCVDRDALRSEKYSIDKLAIEKGVFGDNLTGQIESIDQIPPRSISSQEGTGDEEPKP